MPQKAHFSERLGAAVIDGLICLVGMYVVILLSAIVLEVLGADASSTAAKAGWMAPAGLGVLAYFTAGYRRGRTVGLRATKLRMARASDGLPLAVPRAAARAFASTLFLASMLVLVVYGFSDPPADGYSRVEQSTIGVAGAAFVVWLLGNLWMLFDRRGQALQDKLAGAVVVAESERATARQAFDARVPRGPSPA
jgi:uncharacterized RDD family membrane protein YckC